MAGEQFTGVGGGRIVLEDDADINAGGSDLLADVPEPARSIIIRNLIAQKIPPEQWHDILQTPADVVPPPFALKDSRFAAELFVGAMKNLSPERKVAVWGDYDADGNTSAAILGTLAYDLRPDAGENLKLHIPWRKEGYGLNIPGIKKLADEGVKSLFVVDSGTVAFDAIQYAREQGMEVVVLDHHQPKAGEKLPEGAVIINPHREDETTKSVSDSCAAGIGWLFARDIAQIRTGTLSEAGQFPFVHEPPELVDVAAAIGTVVDVVSLRNPLNRHIVERGLKVMNSKNCPLGIKALKGLFDIRGDITEEDLAFAIGPAFNAAGRVGDPMVGMRLLLAETQEEAERCAKELQAANDERKQFSNYIILKDATRKAEEFQTTHPQSQVLMVEDEHWMRGMVGIVASRLKDRHHLPTFVGERWKNATGEEFITYSARSIEGVNLYHPVEEAFKTLPMGDIISFGGHPMAAGLTIRAEAKERVLAKINEALGLQVEQARAKHELRVPDKIRPEDLTIDNVSLIRKHGPFGAKITPPRLLIKNVQVKHVREMGGEGEDLLVSLGSPTASVPYEGLQYGTVFRAKGTPLANILLDENRHNQAFDAVIEPYVFIRQNGEQAVGYHLIDASPTRVVSQSPSNQEVFSAYVKRMDEFRAKQEEEKKRIENLPLKLAALVEGKTAATQSVLKEIYEAKLSYIDTETTGLKPRHPDPDETNGLTQVAVAKVVKEGKHYRLEAKVFPILPVTPAYFEHQFLSKKAKKEKSAPPAYDQKRSEYNITWKALDVTSTEFKRANEHSPIDTMLVGGEKVPARPFYEVAGKIAQFLDGTVPPIFNAPFDARGLLKHFSDVMVARAQTGSIIPSHLTITDRDAYEAYCKLTAPLAKILKLEEDSQIQTYPDTSFLKYLDRPSNYHCLLAGALMHKGEKAANRLDNVAPDYGVAFLRDPKKHDAREDVFPLPYISHAQYRAFSELAGAGGKIPIGGYSMRDQWELLLRKSGSGATATQDFMTVPGTKTMDGESVQVSERVPVLKLNFSPGANGGNRPGLKSYLTSLAEAKARNSRIPGQLVLYADGNSVVLPDDASPGNDRVPLFTAFNKTLCVDRLLRSGIADNIRAFDSTGNVDITLAPASGDGKSVTVEDVPLRGLRKSLDFLLSEEARPHIKEYLELLQWVNNLSHAGLAALDKSGITVRGLQRDFGDIRIEIPPNKKMVEMIPEIKAHAEQLLAIGSVPGALKAEYTMEDDDEDDDSKKSSTCLTTHYHLDMPNRVLMEISPQLLKLVAQEKNYPLEGEHFVWPGGIVGQKVPDENRYLVHGTLEALQEIGPQVRSAAWLLYRFNQLPDVNPGKTVLHYDGKLELHCEPVAPVETLWILHKSHVPFRVTKSGLEINMPDLMHDAFHWYWEIDKDQKFVKAELKRKKDADRRDREDAEQLRSGGEVRKRRDTRPPEGPPVFLQAAIDRLRKGTVGLMEANRVGELFAVLPQYPLVPVDQKIKEVSNSAPDVKKPLADPLFNISGAAAFSHQGLAIRLSQLHGLQQNFSTLARKEAECTLTPPVIDPLNNREVLIKEFRGISLLARSAHINPLLDSLRDIVKSPDMSPNHQEPSSDGKSPVTLERFGRLTARVAELKPHLETITKDIEAFQTSFDEVRLKDTIFHNVATIHLIQETLSEARKRGQLSTLGEPEYQAMQATLREYYESLSMAEFKRYRLTLDGLQLAKSQERLAKALSVQKGEKPRRSKEKPEEAPPYAAYKAHHDISSAIEKVWEDGKRYKRTLEFSDEIIACAASLHDWQKLAQVDKAVGLVEQIQHQNIGDILAKLKEEGGIRQFERTDGNWVFDVDTLEKKPDYWDARIFDLQKGKRPIPAVPHVVIDTSSMMTLLLGARLVPNDPQSGYLELVKDLAQHGAIIPVITGAVLAEFLNSPVPLMPRDIFKFDEQGKVTDIVYTNENRRHTKFFNGNKIETEYPKWHERLQFLKKLYNEGNAIFVETLTEGAYYEAIRQHPQLQKCFATLIRENPDLSGKLHGKTLLTELSNAELKHFLFASSKPREKFMHQMRAIAIRKDIGEVSLADAIQHLHDNYGFQVPVHVLYEGNDVRGKLLRRKVNAQNGQYMAGKQNDKLAPEYAPGHSKFNPDHVAMLGNTSFLSTAGFLVGLMKSAKSHNAFIVAPDEHNHAIPADINNSPPDSYPGAIATVRRNAGKALTGFERPYRKIIDGPADELIKNSDHSESITGNTPGPWQQHLNRLPPETMRTIHVDHIGRLHSHGKAVLEHYQQQCNKSEQLIREIETCLRGLGQPVLETAKTTEKASVSSPPPPVAAQQTPALAATLVDTIMRHHRLNPPVRKTQGKGSIPAPLPGVMRLELSVSRNRDRIALLEATAALLRERLSGSPENEADADRYISMLQKMLAPPQPRRGVQ